MGGRVGNNASGSAIVVRRTTFDLLLPDLLLPRFKGRSALHRACTINGARLCRIFHTRGSTLSPAVEGINFFAC